MIIMCHLVLFGSFYNSSFISSYLNEMQLFSNISNCVHGNSMLKRGVMLYSYCILQGAFNYVNIVIEPLDQVSNSVSVLCKDGELLVVTDGVMRLCFSANIVISL